MDAPATSADRDTTRVIVLAAFSVIMLLTVILVAAVLYQDFGRNDPDAARAVRDMAIAAMGFAFGSLATMVMRYVGLAG